MCLFAECHSRHFIMQAAKIKWSIDRIVLKWSDLVRSLNYVMRWMVVMLEYYYLCCCKDWSRDLNAAVKCPLQLFINCQHCSVQLSVESSDALKWDSWSSWCRSFVQTMDSARVQPRLSHLLRWPLTSRGWWWRVPNYKSTTPFCNSNWIVQSPISQISVHSHQT